MTDKRTEGELSPRMYRKTALVAAEQFLPADGKIPRGVYSSGNGDPRKRHDLDWMLETLEGEHVLRPGDYICTGPAGERWNVAREIFEATYELAEDTRQEARTTPAGLDEAIALIREAKTTLAPFAVRSAKKPTSSAANSAIWKLEAAVGFLSKPSPPAPAGLDREGVARIIEPSAWRLPTFDRLEDRKVALAKADAILAMVRP